MKGEIIIAVTRMHAPVASMSYVVPVVAFTHAHRCWPFAFSYISSCMTAWFLPRNGSCYMIIHDVKRAQISKTETSLKLDTDQRAVHIRYNSDTERVPTLSQITMQCNTRYQWLDNASIWVVHLPAIFPWDMRGRKQRPRSNEMSPVSALVNRGRRGRSWDPESFPGSLGMPPPSGTQGAFLGVLLLYIVYAIYW